MSKRFLFLAICLVLCCIGMSANAAIIIDEDFEGASMFVDRNWPIKDGTTSPTAAGMAIKGVNLRTTNAGDASGLNGYIAPKMVVSTSGTLTTERHFLGAKSLKITSGGGLSTQKGAVGYNIRGCRVAQFAVGVATETLPAAGTRVGYFRSDWTITTGTVNSTSTDVVEASFWLNFVVNPSAQGIDIVCSNTGSTVGSFRAGVGGWGLVSIIMNPNVANPNAPDTPSAYATFDNWTSGTPSSTIVATGNFKGPKSGTTPATATMLLPGMHVFCNSFVADNYVPRAAVGTIARTGVVDGSWGSDGVDTAGKPYNSSEISWMIAAENGGTLYIDNLYKDNLYHFIDAGTQCLMMESYGRMLEFNTKSNEPEPPAAAASWTLY